MLSSLLSDLPRGVTMISCSVEDSVVCSENSEMSSVTSAAGDTELKYETK